MRSDKSLKETVVEVTKCTGVLPCVKVKKRVNILQYAQAMYDGGARIIEVTMTTPGALTAINEISEHFAGRLWVAAGTVLDAETARQVILHGGSLIVSPSLRPEVITMANRYGVPVYSGAFTATECQAAMEAGVTMVKVFPAQVGGPKYMTNLKMVFPEIQLCPSGGIHLENAGEYIRCGASAISGARAFTNSEMIGVKGLGWITSQVEKYIDAVQQAKQELPELP